MFSSFLIFVSISVLVVFYMITSSRRQNLCFLLSSLSSFLGVLIIVLLRNNSIIDLSSLEESIQTLFMQQIYMFDIIRQDTFALSFLLMSLYIFLFIVFEIVFNNVIPKYNYLVVKDIKYAFVKAVLIFVNIIILLLVVVTFLTILNEIYHVDEGYLSPVMGLLREALGGIL